jgi:hypothetical protein
MPMFTAIAARLRVACRSLRASTIVTFAAAVVAALTLVVAPGVARADDAPIAERGDWEPVNRVLEIPQACTRDGVVISCEQGSSNTEQVPDVSANGGSEASGGATTASAKPATGDDYNEPQISPDWGSLDDYENQEIEEAPIYVGVPAGGYGLHPPAYATPYVAPATTTLAPAWTRPPFGSGPWMIPPSAMMRPAPAPMIMRAPFPLR